MRLKSAMRVRVGPQRWSPCASSDPSCAWIYAPRACPFMSRSKPKSAANDLRQSDSPWAKKSVCASGAGRYIRPQLDSQPDVIRRLVGGAEGRERRGGVLQIRFGQLEAVEAAARHEKQLIAAHVAGGTQLALEIPPLAQQACLRVAAPLAGPGKLRADQREARQIRCQPFNFVGGRQHYPQAAAALGPSIGLGLPLIESHNERHGRIGRRFGNIAPFIDNYLTIT